MKSIDALTLLGHFNNVCGDSTLTTEEKASIGTELLRLIPNEDLFSASQVSLKAVRRSIKDRVVALEQENEQNRQGETPKGTSGRKSKAQAS